MLRLAAPHCCAPRIARRVPGRRHSHPALYHGSNVRSAPRSLPVRRATVGSRTLRSGDTLVRPAPRSRPRARDHRDGSAYRLESRPPSHLRASRRCGHSWDSPLATGTTAHNRRRSLRPKTRTRHRPSCRVPARASSVGHRPLRAACCVAKLRRRRARVWHDGARIGGRRARIRGRSTFPEAFVDVGEAPHYCRRQTPLPHPGPCFRIGSSSADLGRPSSYRTSVAAVWSLDSRAVANLAPRSP